ncbi:hypothetical protein HK405_004435, partial [Cladochytrium tenue]
MQTALHLSDYEDVLEPKKIFAMQALASFQSNHFGACSRAFVRLEDSKSVAPDEREALAALALTIFTR